MGSFAFAKYLRPFFGHQFPRQSVPVVLRRRGHPDVQLYCTSKEKRLAEARSRKSSQREKPAFPESVFAAGTAKRTADFLKRRAGTDPEQAGGLSRDRASFRGEIPAGPLSAPEWRRLKESSSRPERFELRMMELMLAAEADVNIAKSLLAYVAMEKGAVPYMLLLRYLAFCVSGRHLSEVLDTYDVMRRCFKTLDSGAYSLLIKGFSQTERWREALVMLEEIKKVITPSPRNYGDAIAGAFLHDNGETGWMLYGELLELGLTPNQHTLRCLFENAGAEHQQRRRLADVLDYMRENQVYPEEPLAQSIKAWFESLPDEKWRGRFSSVDSSGRCQSCQAELESIELTEEEYAQLKRRVMTDVIEGRDVFNKTTPEELESFKSFVKKSPAFDVIVDGLNVASVSPKGPKSRTLLAVVSELRYQGLNVLVLGRKHMLRPSWNWDRQDIHQIRQKSLCFFTENISEDDPFLLYAALHSGNHCNFVSRDLMRDHKACLSDSATRRLFFKWQRGHQLVVQGYIPGKKVQFQRALRYDTIIQSTGAAWHIPYDEDGGERSTYEVPQRWLCLTKEQQ